MLCSLLVHGLQRNRLLCPPLPPRVCSNSCSMSQSCYLTISSSATPFSFCLQSFPPSGSFPNSWIFASGSQSTGASVSILSMNIQGWFPLGWTSGVFVCLSLNWVGKLICKLSCGFSNLWSLNKNLCSSSFSINFIIDCENLGRKRNSLAETRSLSTS